MSWRVLSPIGFAGVAVAFFLPFATVSCDDESVTFTGVELAFGQVEEPSPQSTFDDEIESESTAPALVAFLAAIAGLVLGVVRWPGAGVASAIGTVAILVLGASADQLFGPTVERPCRVRSGAARLPHAHCWARRRLDRPAESEAPRRLVRR